MDMTERAMNGRDMCIKAICDDLASDPTRHRNAGNDVEDDIFEVIRDVYYNDEITFAKSIIVTAGATFCAPNLVATEQIHLAGKVCTPRLATLGELNLYRGGDLQTPSNLDRIEEVKAFGDVELPGLIRGVQRITILTGGILRAPLLVHVGELRAAKDGVLVLNARYDRSDVIKKRVVFDSTETQEDT